MNETPKNRFETPPRPRGESGEPRRVGVELEIAGLELSDAADAVREVFGGEVREHGTFEWQVTGTDVGDFAIVVDARMLREGAYLELFDGVFDPEDVEEPLEKAVGWLAEQVVPFEVTTPPLPLAELPRVERLARALAARGARGTGSRLRYALGLHLNPEVPSTTSESIRRHLQAFLVLYEEIADAQHLDFTRRLSPFIDPFSPAYARLVLAPDYEPTLEELAVDYVAHNPTRNRPLDLLPLFVHLLGPEILVGVPEDEKLSPRPTFHYRFPDCRVDEPSWSVAGEWNRWLRVERLAERPDELARRCRQQRPAESAKAPGFLDKVEEGIRQALRDEDGEE